MDEMIMHENMEQNFVSVTVVEKAVDEIIDLPSRRKRKLHQSSNLNVKKLKYRLY